MKYGIFSVKDVKSGSFFPPFHSLTHGTAERQFSVNVNDDHPNNMLRKYPADFELWCVGTYDDVSGDLVGLEAQLLCNAAQLVEVKP